MDSHHLKFVEQLRQNLNHEVYKDDVFKAIVVSIDCIINAKIEAKMKDIEMKVVRDEE